MKILVIGGMHGNEPLGPALVAEIKEKPIKNVDVVLANEPALRANTRFANQDLNRSFPGNDKSRLYEEKRAAELLQLCEGYDIVFDFHNTNCSGNDCSFVGQAASKLLYEVSAFLGLRRVIVADYDCINKYADNCISVEISLDSPRMNVEEWYSQISNLANLEQLPKSDIRLELYKFVYRMSLDDRNQLDLTTKQLFAFEPLDTDLATAMGVSSPAFPIFIADAYTPYNYGGLLNKIK